MSTAAYVLNTMANETTIASTFSGDIAKSWGVPLIAKVPLEPAVAGCGDEGTPAVLRYPNSESAKAFMQAADAMVRTLAVFKSEGDGVLKTFNYEFAELPEEEV